MQTDRKEWLDKLKSLSNNYKVVIIQGLRRIGKTLLMNNLAMDNSFLEYEKISFQVGIFGQNDTLEAINIIKKVKENSNKKYLILVDEFQDLKNWDKFFKTLYDIENIKVIATGSVSANKGLVDNTEGGRFTYLHMNTLSFDEFKRIFQKNSLSENDDWLFNLYATMGSYPDQEFNLDTNKLNFYKKQISENIIEKVKNISMLEKANLKDAQKVNNVLLHIIENNGRNISINGISQRLNYHIETVSKIINYLKQTFLIYEIANSKFSRGRAAVLNRKYYLTDHTFYLFVDNVVYDNLEEYKKNMLFENVIFNHVRSQIEKHEGTLHFEKDNKKDIDIDLIIKIGQIKRFFEIKNTTSETSLSKNQKKFAKVNKLSVIYLGETKEVENIKYINYIEFIKEVKKWL